MLLIPQCLLFQILMMIRVTRQVVVAPAAFLVSTIQKPVRSMCICVATIQLRFTTTLTHEKQTDNYWNFHSTSQSSWTNFSRTFPLHLYNQMGAKNVTLLKLVFLQHDSFPCHPTWPLHTKLSLILEILKFFNHSYFAKLIMTRKPKHCQLD